jgi:hypothetical protein
MPTQKRITHPGKPIRPREPNEGIELLYTRDCPAWPQALDNLEQAMQELDIQETPHAIPVDTMDQANEYGFFASPTVHIDGVDIDPHARRTSKRGLGVGRPYFSNGRSYSSPPVELLKQALEELYLNRGKG